MKTIKLTTQDGRQVEYIDEIIGQGGMKDVYFSPDRSYVVAFFRDPLDFQGKERLRMITGMYREGIFEKDGAEYWKDLFCWPTAVVEKAKSQPNDANQAPIGALRPKTTSKPTPKAAGGRMIGSSTRPPMNVRR